MTEITQNLNDLASTVEGLKDAGLLGLVILVVLAVIVYLLLNHRQQILRLKIEAGVQQAIQEREKRGSDLEAERMKQENILNADLRAYVQSVEKGISRIADSIDVINIHNTNLDASTSKQVDALAEMTKTQMLMQAALRSMDTLLGSIQANTETIAENQLSFNDQVKELTATLGAFIAQVQEWMKESTGSVMDMQHLLTEVAAMRQDIGTLEKTVNEKVKTKEIPTFTPPPVQELPPQVQQ